MQAAAGMAAAVKLHDCRWRRMQARDARRALEAAQIAAHRHPSMSAGSRRILATKPSLDHFMPLHATLAVSPATVATPENRSREMICFH